MKKVIFLSLFFISKAFTAQTVSDLLTSNTVKTSWLGVDFSHVKLIGKFSQTAGSEKMEPAQVRDKYFKDWNELIMAEPKKFDVAGMIRKKEVYYDVQNILDLNANASVKNMEAFNTPKYTNEDISKFVSEYNTEGKEGIGILFIAESLNKNAEEACFHFVAINMSTKQILLQERINSKPAGFGFRNYWAGAIYDVVKQIRNEKYENWKSNSLDKK